MGRRFKKKKDKSRCTVYGIWDGRDMLRYVGQTRLELEARFASHKKHAFSQSPGYFGDWLAGELKAKRNVTIRALDDNATWNVSEVLWIERMKQEGHPLLNVTRGGSDSLRACQREGCVPQAYTDWKAKRQRAATMDADRKAELYAECLRLGIEPVRSL